jgi:outer membrane receptor protein involved in Fe transport
MVRRITILLLVALLPAMALAQSGQLRGRLIDASTKEPLVGATVALIGTKIGAVTDGSGNYSITGIPANRYTVRFAYVGYVSVQRTITVGDAAMTLDAALDPTTIQTGEVVAEANRARERETPVAFSDVDAMAIEQKISGQDAPMLVQGVPGVYTYSPDGVANGEAKLFVRGFNQNYVQVLINGVPTNDPESNSVYWSNWGSVSSAASSIQIQRGAGSSLYGAGAFGGSFNIVTKDAPATSYFGARASFGDPMNTMYGAEINTGLIDNTFAGTLRVDRKIAEGSRTSGRYEGVNYYLSGAWYIDAQQSLKLVLHGAPQEHGYSFSQHIAYFQKYGYDANPANFLPRNVVEQLPANATTGQPSYGLLDDSRELVDPNYVNLAHNMFHKPQLELHYRYDIDPTSSLGVTGFYSMGRGGGSSMNSTGTLFSVNSRTGAVTDKYGEGGVLTDVDTARVVYLGPAYQRNSYSLHNQTGILTNYDFMPREDLKLTVGGEFRYWWADHPGHYTNLFGKQFITAQSYQRRDTNGVIMSNTFRRRTYQGDLNGPESDIWNVFGWDMAGDKDPGYTTQYRNYLGETPQFTLFAQGNWAVEKFNFLATLQYVWYQYKLTENMPSENGIGRQLNSAELASIDTVEGPYGNGKFLMKENSSTRWYTFDLVRATRTRGFFQPKVGVNYNVTDNVNVFANYAHVERFVDLSIYYNQGLVNPAAEDEKSNQFELGTGWTSEQYRAKVNGYWMQWDNKSARIQDVTKAGEPGYDRNGFRTELVGTSRHMGLEVETSVNLGKIFTDLPLEGLTFTATGSFMDNDWTKVLDQVKTSKDAAGNTIRNPFNTSALNAAGAVDTLYFDELEGTPVASGPQTMLSFALQYDQGMFFAGLGTMFFAKHFALDGASYLAVDGSFTSPTTFSTIYGNRLPERWVWNFNVGARVDFGMLKGTASLQVLNLFDTEFLEDADRFGVIPGLKRAVRFNVSLGI